MRRAKQSSVDQVIMKLIHSVAALALATLAASGPARADWLKDAWSEESVRQNGSPAITIGRDSIHMVLPAATLRQAHNEGFTTERALGDFLEKYGQRCSGLANLNAPRPNLKVTLSLQNPARFEDVQEGDEVLAEFKAEYLKRSAETETPVLFTVSPEQLEFTLDYAPKRQVRCVVPELSSS
jgi:hypothetical protein